MPAKTCTSQRGRVRRRGVVSGEALGRMDKLLAEHFGVDTTTAACIIVAVLAVVWFVRQNSGPSDPPPTVELHPKHRNTYGRKRRSIANQTTRARPSVASSIT